MNELYEYAMQVARENIIAQGGIMIGVLTSLYYSVRALSTFIWTRFLRQFKYCVYLDETTDSYDAFSLWYRDHYQSKFRDVEASIVSVDEGATNTYKLKLTQFIDLNWIWYDKRLIFISKERDRLENSNNMYNLYLNKYSMWGLFSDKALNRLCQEVLDYYKTFKKLKKTVSVHYNFSGYGFTEKPLGVVKTFNHIFFDRKQELIDDLITFNHSRQHYTDKHLKYKRGYLFHGPPGTGKTSLALAIAVSQHRDIYVFGGSKESSDTTIISFFSHIPPNSIILIEDADRFVVGDDTKFNLSTFLNGLDGVYAPNDVIVILTTNHIDKLDKAILRDGRFDLKLEVGIQPKEIVSDYMSYYYDKQIQLQGDNKLKMSEIQNICLSNGPDRSLDLIEASNLL